MRSKRNAKTCSQLGKGCHSGSPASSEHIGARTVAHAFVHRELLQEEEKKVEDTERMGLMQGTHVFKHRDHLNIAYGKVTSLMGKRNTPRSGTQFRAFDVQFDLLLTTTIQSLSLSYILSSIPSSSSSSISGVITFVIRLFLDFPFDASASASSTT